MTARPRLRKLIVLVAPYILLVAFLFITNPSKLPLPLLLIPFALLFLSLFGTIFYFTSVIPNLRVYTRRKRAVLSACLALLPTLLLMLKSLNQLAPRDAIILTIFIVSLALYLTRTTLPTK